MVHEYMDVSKKWWVVPNKPMGFPTKHQHFGVEIGGTPIFGNTHILMQNFRLQSKLSLDPSETSRSAVSLIFLKTACYKVQTNPNFL